MNNFLMIEKNYAQAVTGINEDWLKTSNDDWYRYIISLPVEIQITYLCVILENQVVNGGFHQYFVNGYGQFAKETIKALIEIGAKEKAELLKDALDKVNIYNDSDEVLRKKLLTRNHQALFVEDTLFDALDQIDTYYYDSEEDIKSLLENYLEKNK